jgi:hypothetical protein
MPIAIKPLKRRKKATHKRKSMTNKQRWGEVIITYKERKVEQ